MEVCAPEVLHGLNIFAHSRPAQLKPGLHPQEFEKSSNAPATANVEPAPADLSLHPPHEPYHPAPIPPALFQPHTCHYASKIH